MDRIERQLDDSLLINHLTNAVAVRFNQPGIDLHFYGLGNLADLKNNRDRRITVNLKHNSGLNVSGETLKTGFQLIGPDR